MTLLNNCLEKTGILSKTQLGFIPNNRTSDAHIILHNLIQKHCHKNNSKIYSCFIDFSRAFDTIPRDILLQKLLNYNIKGNFFNTIRNIYANDVACVNIENNLTDHFKVNQGVRQGCVLSPTLFNIYMSDLTNQLNAAQGKLNLGTNDINCLIWADDIVLLSESEEGLKEMLKIMEKFCNDNKLIINTEKSKCMIFNKTGRLIRKKFSLNNFQLEMVRSYKYLGFLITTSGEINSGLKDLRDRAMKAFFKLKNSMGPSFYHDISTTILLIDTLIKPIILYMSDFWGCLKIRKENPVDNLHIMICKQILQVQKQTTNIGVLLELGRIPLTIYAQKAGMKNWERIRKKTCKHFIVCFV